MDSLKVCFVGVGSIARRHIKNLRALCESRKIALQVDAFRHSLRSNNSDGIDREYYSLEEMDDSYDAVFITNPTSCHIDTIKQFSGRSRYFFVEKPICFQTQIDEAMALKDISGTYYIACPLRYNPVISFVKENVSPESVVAVRSISSSYLPDWRAGVDYRDTYSAHRNMGGGVSIDLIHEWDYLTYIFGFPNKVKSLIGKKSDLEIDSDDYAIYLAEYESMILELHLDYFGRKPIRRMEIITKDDTIVADILGGSIEYLVSGRTVKLSDSRDEYQTKELDLFLNIVDGCAQNTNDISHAIKVLRLTQGEL